jgi:hypothetical protein
MVYGSILAVYPFVDISVTDATNIYRDTRRYYLRSRKVEADFSRQTPRKRQTKRSEFDDAMDGSSTNPDRGIEKNLGALTVRHFQSLSRARFGARTSESPEATASRAQARSITDSPKLHSPWRIGRLTNLSRQFWRAREGD